MLVQNYRRFYWQQKIPRMSWVLKGLSRFWKIRKYNNTLVGKEETTYEIVLYIIHFFKTKGVISITLNESRFSRLREAEPMEVFKRFLLNEFENVTIYAPDGGRFLYEVFDVTNNMKELLKQYGIDKNKIENKTT